MGRNSHYFVNREERAAHAQNVVETNRRMFADAIEYSVAHSTVMNLSTFPWNATRMTYNTDGNPYAIYDYPTPLYLVPMDTVSALFSLGSILQNAERRKTPLVLNFASYKNPGGKFLDGSSAQEESLCHESTLYNVLSDERIVRDFYAPHRGDANRCIYYDDSLITPNIVFQREIDGKREVVYADVITCAAPNAHAAKRYFHVTEEEIHDAMCRRIFSILFHAMSNDNDVLILGAFGCGVFGNDPETVATIFRDKILNQFPRFFSAVVFAVPNTEHSMENYRAFDKIINSKEEITK